MKAAEDLWEIICNKAGVHLPLSFVQDSSLTIGSYRINGTTITHNSTANNNAAVMAVAAIAEYVFDATMDHPSEDGITLNIGNIQQPEKVVDWDNLELIYTPTLVRNNYVNLRASGWDRTWFHWHHVPTEGSGGASFHRSWWEEWCIKYPQLAPSIGAINWETKPDITHEDFAPLVYQEWVQRGKPDICSLFELDGNGYWWALRFYPAPGNLNLSEKELFERAIVQGIYPTFTIGQRLRASDGNRYPVTRAFATAIAAIPRNTVGYPGTTPRFNYTALYLAAYQAVIDYFDAQGATHVMFNILGYHCYRCLPVGDWSLSRYHVYYTPQRMRDWNISDAANDAVEFNKWKAAGAKVILRANDLFQPGRDRSEMIWYYLTLTKPDGVQLPPYHRPERGQEWNYLEAFRAMRR